MMGVLKMKIKNINFNIMTSALIFFCGCEDKEVDSSGELNSGPISVTTGNVNVSDFYFDLISGEEIESSDLWSIAVKTEGDYNMPSIFFNEDLDVAVYDDLLFGDVTELPSTFLDHLEADHSVFRYEGSHEILSYNMEIHKVGVTYPDYVYVIRYSDMNKIFKVQFIEYLSGVTVFQYSEV